MATTRRVLKEQDLLFPLDHRDAYRQIRNYLAGRFIGATRDEVLLHELLKCLFCKLFIRKNLQVNADFKDGIAVAKAYRESFAQLRNSLPLVFESSEELLLDPTSLAYVDQRLDDVEIDNPKRDLFGDAYEAFTSSGFRGQEGQFFTPQNAINLLVSMVNPEPGENIIDPACGAGGFLSGAARHLLAKGANQEAVASSLFGVDKDRYLVGLAASRLALLTLRMANVFCGDSLAWRGENGDEFPPEGKIGEFDIVLTNPPFGARIVSVSREIQATFELGHRWVSDSEGDGKYQKANDIQSSVAPQVLFVERCISLVRQGGRVGMVVPESLISGSNHRYVVQYIREVAHIHAVIGMPESLFKTSGKSGTHTKTCLLVMCKKTKSGEKAKNRIFMAEARWCGHDSRGRQIGRDELPLVFEKYQSFLRGKLKEQDHLGYAVALNGVQENVLSPRYYNPDVESALTQLANTHELINLGDLVTSGTLTVKTGDEIGKLNYGTGRIPFVRTSDISNWEIKVDPKHCISEEIYSAFAAKQDVREGDILMVRDGTYLIGTCAYITRYDTKIVFQSHLFKLRINDPKKLSPFLLLAILSSVPVQKQIRAKQFTQDIIDSLGDRIYELILPIPKDRKVGARVAKTVEQAINERIEARELSRKACVDVIGIDFDALEA